MTWRVCVGVRVWERKSHGGPEFGVVDQGMELRPPESRQTMLRQMALSIASMFSWVSSYSKLSPEMANVCMTWLMMRFCQPKTIIRACADHRSGIINKTKQSIDEAEAWLWYCNEPQGGGVTQKRVTDTLVWKTTGRSGWGPGSSHPGRMSMNFMEMY